jgi:NADPH:quinone reductase-like Zn-dependent oxidoreductase
MVTVIRGRRQGICAQQFFWTLGATRWLHYVDPVDVLVLGGTHHVGRSVVEVALARGHSVTTLTRGVSGPPAPGAHAFYADRLDRAAVESVLGDQSWDAVIDTWSAAPRAVRDGAGLLADRVGHYCYVSSRSVYR